MPTILSHPAAALAAAPYYGRRLPRALFALGAICSSLPDADIGAFGLGIPYEHPLGHRGFTHSLFFAVLFSAFVTFACRRFMRTPPSIAVVFSFLLICLASHGLLDAMTDGGKGVGFFIPFDSRRFFFPFRPIHVSPIGFDAPSAVLWSEVKWVWLPSMVIMVFDMIRRSIFWRRFL